MVAISTLERSSNQVLDEVRDLRKFIEQFKTHQSRDGAYSVQADLVSMAERVMSQATSVYGYPMDGPSIDMNGYGAPMYESGPPRYGFGGSMHGYGPSRYGFGGPLYEPGASMYGFGGPSRF